MLTQMIFKGTARTNSKPQTCQTNDARTDTNFVGRKMGFVAL